MEPGRKCSKWNNGRLVVPESNDEWSRLHWRRTTSLQVGYLKVHTAFDISIKQAVPQSTWYVPAIAHENSFDLFDAVLALTKPAIIRFLVHCFNVFCVKPPLSGYHQHAPFDFVNQKRPSIYCTSLLYDIFRQLWWMSFGNRPIVMRHYKGRTRQVSTPRLFPLL